MHRLRPCVVVLHAVLMTPSTCFDVRAESDVLDDIAECEPVLPVPLLAETPLITPLLLDTLCLVTPALPSVFPMLDDERSANGSESAQAAHPLPD